MGYGGSDPPSQSGRSIRIVSRPAAFRPLWSRGRCLLGGTATLGRSSPGLKQIDGSFECSRWGEITRVAGSRHFFGGWAADNLLAIGSILHSCTISGARAEGASFGDSFGPHSAPPARSPSSESVPSNADKACQPTSRTDSWCPDPRPSGRYHRNWRRRQRS